MPSMHAARQAGVIVGLMLASFAGCRPAGSGTAEPSSLPLPVGVEWQLIELEGAEPGLGAGGRPATLQLNDAESRAAGFAGCNRFSGGYTSNGVTLRLSPLAVTRMACDAGMQLEQRYTSALQTVDGYRATSDTLTLLAGARVVARFARP